MTRVLALVGIVAILLWLRIPQRINWDELRGFKGADQVAAQLEPLQREFTPASPPPTNPTKPAPEPTWMKAGCRLAGASHLCNEYKYLMRIIIKSGII